MTDDQAATTGGERVCPRCGSNAGEGEYCKTCGLHLWGQPELPTRSTWEQRSSQTPASAAPGLSLIDRLRGLDRKILVGSFVAIVASVLIIALVSQSGDDELSPGAVADAHPDQECFDLWNEDPQIQDAAGMQAIVGRETGSQLCIVTFFGGGSVFQYLERSSGYEFSGISSTSGTPAATRDVNAVVRSDGSLSFK